MIRFAIAGFWLCAVTIAALFFSFQAAGKKPEVTAEAAPFLGGLDYVKTDVLSVPLIKEGAIHGYFLARLVYTVEPEKVKALTVPAETLLTDAVYSYVFSSREIDFTEKETIDLEAFRTGLRESVNARIGSALIQDVLIEQIDYLSKAEIRDNTIRRRAAAIAAQ